MTGVVIIKYQPYSRLQPIGPKSVQHQFLPVVSECFVKQTVMRITDMIIQDEFA